MTTPYERTRAVLGARQLLQKLAVAPEDANLENFREHARTLLRHFPEAFHLWLSSKAMPDIWSDPDAKGYE
jgi:hypothetical protein